MLDLLRENTLLLLFVVTAVGYVAGRVSIFGIRLGAAAILFVGLLFGALDPSLALPDFVIRFGLVVFLYALGLSNGSSFFRAFRQEGRQQLVAIVFFLTIPFLLTLGFFFLLPLTGAEAAGIYSGTATNTASLAGILDLITSSTASNSEALVAETAVAFAIGYPLGVVGRMLILVLFQRLWRIDFEAEAHALRDRYPVTQDIVNYAIRITNPEAERSSLRALMQENDWDVIFGRVARDGRVTLLTGESELQLDDVILIAGEREKADEVLNGLGKLDEGGVFEQNSVYVKRRVFVSNQALVGKELSSLDLKERYGAIVTRVRRGDRDLLASRSTILELGDRVRVLARRSDIEKLTELFGDSYEAVSQVNLLSLGFGVTFGLLLGMVFVSLPGEINFQLGFAVGVLLVALILGAIQRTGSLVWTLPYSVNQTLQQTGLFLLLAGIGVQSGNSLVTTIAGTRLLVLVGTGAGIVVLYTILALLLGHKLFKIPFSLLSGMLASQPAVLSFMAERSDTQLPEIGFTMAFPLAIIMKVLYAQILYAFLSG